MSVFKDFREEFHKRIVSELLFIDSAGVVGNADKGSRISREIAKGIFENVGGNKIKQRLPGQEAGRIFEVLCSDFLEKTCSQLGHLTAFSHDFRLENCNIENYEQYEHLEDLKQLASEIPQLEVNLSNDYVIKPDIMIAKSPLSDKQINSGESLIDATTSTFSPLRHSNQSVDLLHASVSCKWTMRSDRAQNARSEALNLIRNRKGRVPHIAVIIGEPLPSRIASLALGTGDVDCVYHFALPELIEATRMTNEEEAMNLLNIMISGKRLRDISDLPFDLLA